MEFPISRDPPEGGTRVSNCLFDSSRVLFPISRDPPEGGTLGEGELIDGLPCPFPISRDPPEGGTLRFALFVSSIYPVSNF